jgi:hypothetical protein
MMNLPKSWNEIDVVQFREIRELYTIEDTFTREVEILAALSNVSSDELEDYDITEVSELLKTITFINSEPSKNYKHELGPWKFKPFSKLTCGEFIDLEHFFTNDYTKHIGHIAAICYRKHKINKWGELIYEPYDFNPFDRCYEFDDFKIVDIYGLIPEYLAFRENFLNTYVNLFDEGDDDEEDEEDKPKTSEEVKAEKERQSARKWGWERLLYSLCNEDLTKMKEVTNLPLILTFNMLGMKKELNL